MTVYLIGDSVRLASEPYTRAALPEADMFLHRKTAARRMMC